jgi:methylase of polypeptide subunit release factors
MGQGDSVCAILEHAGYEICDCVQDFNERERAVLARKSREDSLYGNKKDKL